MWEKVNTEGSDNSENQSTVFTITYDNKGFGEDLEPLSLMGNTTIYDSAVPTLYAEGYIFQGWYYNDKKVISGQFILTENITLTAKWLKKDDTDKTAPADVTDLSISLDNHRPVLKWINPKDDDFNTVIITYSKKNDTTTYGGHIGSGAGNSDT